MKDPDPTHVGGLNDTPVPVLAQRTVTEDATLRRQRMECLVGAEVVGAVHIVPVLCDRQAYRHVDGALALIGKVFQIDDSMRLQVVEARLERYAILFPEDRHLGDAAREGTREGAIGIEIPSPVLTQAANNADTASVCCITMSPHQRRRLWIIRDNLQSGRIRNSLETDVTYLVPVV
jgi:hypothetical protein